MVRSKIFVIILLLSVFVSCGKDKGFVTTEMGFSSTGK